MQPQVTIVFCLLFLAGFLGCRREPAAVNQLEQRVERIRPLVTCLNTLSSTIQSTYVDYYQWVKSKKVGPTCKEEKIAGVRKVEDPSGCLDSLVVAEQSQTDRPEVRAAIRKYRQAAAEILRSTSILNPYYSNQRYVSDKCKLGRQEHRKLGRSFSRFLVADAAIRSRIEREADAIRMAELEALKKTHGSTLSYRSRKALMDAKKMMSRVQKEIARNEPRGEVIAGAIADFRTAAGAFEAFRKVNRQKSDNPKAYASYVEAFVEFSEVAARLGKVRVWDSKAAASNEYLFNQLVKAYNHVIVRANSVEQDLSISK